LVLEYLEENYRLHLASQHVNPDFNGGRYCYKIAWNPDQ
jgi:hypothetical protein